MPLGMQGNITGRVGAVFSMGAGIGTAISERRGGGGWARASAVHFGFPCSFFKWSYFSYVIIKEKQIWKITVWMKHFPFYG